LIHIPLPQPDFHNVRHHDDPGEVCIYHDHLLRWHPSASHDVDASILHWHWILPSLDESIDGQGPDDAQHHRSGLGPYLHANIGDGLEPDWSTASWLSADSLPTSLDRGVTAKLLLVDGFLDNPIISFVAPPIRAIVNGALPCAQSVARPMLQRWNC
jgi:hypothetical protein